MKIHRWDTMQEDALGPTVGRRALHGEKITLARFRFDKGNKVAMHHHPNDQITTVASGAIHMICGNEEFDLKAGDMVHVPPDVPHANVALEDSVIVEIFSPIREDWIKGDDSYLRKK